MSATECGMQVSVRRDGSFSAMIPTDPAVDVARTAALRELAADEARDWGMVREALPHRRERRPLGFEQMDRERQERSLGRPYGAGERQGAIGGSTEVNFLHPLRGDVYLFTLASMLPELAPRLGRMRAEMEARPEEFGPSAAVGGRLFDLRMFLEAGSVWEEADAAEGFARAAEATLAAFVCYVAAPRTERGGQAGQQVLCGLGMWCQRSRWVVGTWLRWPWWPDLGE